MDPTGYLWFKYECFLISGCKDIDFGCKDIDFGCKDIDFGCKDIDFLKT